MPKSGKISGPSSGRNLGHSCEQAPRPSPIERDTARPRAITPLIARQHPADAETARPRFRAVTPIAACRDRSDDGRRQISIWAGAAKGSALPIAILLLVMLMIVPVPAMVLDIGFIANIMISLAVLMVALNAAKPLDFSAFPTVLLFATLFRLALNVASTRVVLVDGHHRRSRGGACHRSVRRVPDRRRLYRRAVRLCGADDHQSGGDHQGRGPRVRGVGALHARCLARQADGDRRRSQRRAGHPRRSQGTAAGSRDRGRFLRLDGRRHPSS